MLVTVMLFVEEERIMPEPWRRPIVPFMPLRVVVVLVYPPLGQAVRQSVPMQKVVEEATVVETPVLIIVPMTCNEDVGVEVPIPTLPSLFITNLLTEPT